LGGSFCFLSLISFIPFDSLIIIDCFCMLHEENFVRSTNENNWNRLIWHIMVLCTVSIGIHIRSNKPEDAT
jgi:hypothetical protein